MKEYMQNKKRSMKIDLKIRLVLQFSEFKDPKVYQNVLQESCEYNRDTVQCQSPSYRGLRSDTQEK